MGLYERNETTSVGVGSNLSAATVSFLKRTYQLLGASMVAAAIGAYLTMPYAAMVQDMKWFIFGAELLILFFGLRMSRGNPGLNLFMLFSFTFLFGVSMVPLLAQYIGSGNGGLIGNAFLMTSILFGSLSMFAINTKTDFSSWGKPLFITLIVIIIASLVNYFILQSPLMHIVITAGVLLLFAIFTIYDTQNIINGAYESPVDAAVSLFIDFGNMFVSILQLLGLFGSDD